MNMDYSFNALYSFFNVLWVQSLIYVVFSSLQY